MARPTIHDVAKKAGVGIGTVSRVLNNSPKVSDATRKRVLTAIQELGFKPSVAARQLPRRTRVHNIGVITQPFNNYFSFVERLRGVQQALSEVKDDYELVLFNAGSLENYDERLHLIASHGLVEGLLIIDLDLTDRQYGLLQSANIPVVGLNHSHDRAWPCITTDNIEGGYLAGKHLLDLGHRRIAYVGDNLINVAFGFTTSAERFEGFGRALETAGVRLYEEYVLLGPHGYETSRTLCKDLMALAPLPTAIFAMSDRQALGCIAAIREAGLDVPGDISVIGYDDLDVSHHIGLTTVRQHLEDVGRLGLTYLLDLINHRVGMPLPQPPPLEVIPRLTTRPLMA